MLCPCARLHRRSKHIIKFNDMVCLNTTLHLAPDRSLANSSIELDLSIDSKSCAPFDHDARELPVPGREGSLTGMCMRLPVVSHVGVLCARACACVPSGAAVYDKTFDLAHLGKVCADIPDVPTAKVCAEFEDTNLTKHEFKTCIDLTLSALGHHIGRKRSLCREARTLDSPPRRRARRSRVVLEPARVGRPEEGGLHPLPRVSGLPEQHGARDTVHGGCAVA